MTPSKRDVEDRIDELEEDAEREQAETVLDRMPLTSKDDADAGGGEA